MASKSDKGKKDLKKSAPAASKHTNTKPSSKKAKEEDEEDDDDDEPETPKSAAKKNAKAAPVKSKGRRDEDDDDDDDVEEDEVDEWYKVEEEEEWDPDFDEFDIPRSRAKKGSAPSGKKSAKPGDDDDLGLDDDFKNLDLFDDGSFEDEDDDF